MPDAFEADPVKARPRPTVYRTEVVDVTVPAAQGAPGRAPVAPGGESTSTPTTKPTTRPTTGPEAAPEPTVAQTAAPEPVTPSGASAPAESADVDAEESLEDPPGSAGEVDDDRPEGDGSSTPSATSPSAPPSSDPSPGETDGERDD